MIRVLAQSLLRLPEGGQQQPVGKLPWSNGSLLSGKLQPGGTPGTAFLQLGGYRLQAQVPGHVRMGQVWLQLLDNSMPAKFRLMSDRQAEEAMLNILNKQAQASGSASLTQNTAQQRLQDQLQQFVDQHDLPFRIYAQNEPNRFLVCDREEHHPQGTIREVVRNGTPILSGRMDLERLGAVAFTLQASADKWSLNLYVDRQDAMEVLRPEFMQWIQQHAVATSFRVAGKMQAGLPSEHEDAL